MGPGVNLCIAAAKAHNAQIPTLQIGTVDVVDLQFAARRRPHIASDVEHVIIVEIETGDGPVRVWIRRLFGQLKRFSARSLARSNDTTP